VTTLILVRHATNDWVRGKLAGWTAGVHLNEEGRAQASALAQRLAQVPIAAIYSSPLERAMETAQAVAAPHALGITIVESIGEVRYGEWTGAELKELKQHPLWAGVQFYPSTTRFPGGETLGEVQCRAVAALEALRAQHDERTLIVAVSHADVIRLVLAHYIGIHTDLFQRLVIAPASVSALHFGKMGVHLVAYNETGSLNHLQPEPETTDQETPTSHEHQGHQGHHEHQGH